MIIAVLKIYNGSLEGGFSTVELVIIDTRTDDRTPVQGSLPPATTLHDSQADFQHIQQKWRSAYGLWLSLPPGMEVPADPLTNQTIQALRVVKSDLDAWLESSEFLPIRDSLLTNINNLDRLIVETNNFELQRLPWRRLRIFQNRPNLEVAIHSNPNRFRENKLRWPVQMLAILGSDEHINLTVDENFIKNLPGADIKILKQPSLDELYHAIKNNSWDIFFFAGHGSTDTDGTNAILHLKPDEPPITIDALETYLRKAVEKGLKLAIFNSCNGLGIPRRLADLEIYIPYVIVMREPIHDKLAHKFLEIFLKYFTQQRYSLQQAFQKARRDLGGWRHQFPNADYLPIIFHHPENPPLFYPRLNPLDHLEAAIRAGIYKLNNYLSKEKYIEKNDEEKT